MDIRECAEGDVVIHAPSGETWTVVRKSRGRALSFDVYVNVTEAIASNGRWWFFISQDGFDVDPIARPLNVAL